MKRIEHKDNKWIFSFIEYVPENAECKLPLIIQLHGAGERGNGDDELAKVDIHGFSKFICDKNINARFVMPQRPKNNIWSARVESIIKFIEQLKENFDIDENRIYLTGLSMGGFGTWLTSMATPNTFAAIAPVCGGSPSWFADTLKNLPVWVFHGADDTTVPVVYSDMLVDKLKLCGGNVKYTRLEGVKHNAWDYTYDQELLDWLLGHCK